MTTTAGRPLYLSTGSVAPLDGIATGHAVQFYESDDVLLESVTDFIGAALRGGDAGIVIATAAHRSGIEERLLAAGIDLAAARAAGRYVEMDAAETLARLMVDGAPDRSRFREVIGGAIAQAGAERGHVRAFGEMVALLALEGEPKAALQLEALWNELRQSMPFALLCAYPMTGPAGALRAPFGEVCAQHTHVIPADSYAVLPTSEAQLRMVVELQQKALWLEAEVTARKRVEAQLREQLEAVESVSRIGQLLNAELDVERLVQAVTDAATELSGARFGAFFYSLVDERGETHAHYTLSGTPREAFDQFPMPRNTAIFGPTFTGQGIIRLNDVTEDPRYGQNEPNHGTPAGHLPVRSYLAVPVISRIGEVLGGIFLGHPQPGAFSEQAERIVAGLAAQAAIALDNARLYQQAQEQTAIHVALNAALRQADQVQRRLAAIVLSSEDAIIGKTLDAVITDWNAAAERMYGYSADEAIGQPIAMLVPPEIRDELPTIMSRLRRGERIVHYETERVRKDGTRLNVALSISPVRDTDGTLTGAATIARDITAQKRAEAEREQLLAQEQAARAEAQEAVRVRDEFLGSVSHDLKSPLTTIKGHAQMLARRVSRMEQPELNWLWEGLARIDTTATTMSALLGELVDLARLQAGQALELRREPVDLALLVREAVQDHQQTTDQHTLHFRTTLDALVGEWDGLRLGRVVANLLSNAIKYSPDGGSVHVALASDRRSAVLSVRDEGMGIPAADLPHVFDRFHRAANVARNMQGTGLGLAGVKQIVEQHGGGVTIASVEGEGTTVTVRLPLA